MSASTCNFSINILTLDLLSFRGISGHKQLSQFSYLGQINYVLCSRNSWIRDTILSSGWPFTDKFTTTSMTRNSSVVGAVAWVYSQKDYGLAPWSSGSQCQRVLGPWRGRVCQEVIKSLGTSLSREIKCLSFASWEEFLGK